MKRQLLNVLHIEHHFLALVLAALDLIAHIEKVVHDTHSEVHHCMVFACILYRLTQKVRHGLDFVLKSSSRKQS